jgi:hypothetical protein
MRCLEGKEDILPIEKEKGPPIEVCVEPTAITRPTTQGSVRFLFGERTGDQGSCLVTPPKQRISKVFCYMENGEPKNAPASIADKLKLRHCNSKRYDTSACTIGYGAVHGVVNYISINDEQVVCVEGSAEKDTGARYWGIVGGD